MSDFPTPLGASRARVAAHCCLALSFWVVCFFRNSLAKPLKLVRRFLTPGHLLQITGWRETFAAFFLDARFASEGIEECTLTEHNTMTAEPSGSDTVMAQEALMSQVVAMLSMREVWQLRSVSHSWLSLPRTRAVAAEPQSDPAEPFVILDRKGGIDRLLELALRDSDLLNNQDCAGCNLLMKAAQLGERRLCLSLLALRADVSARGGNAWTPLHFAAASGHTEACRLLLASHANVEARSKDGYAPLFYAYRAGADDVAEQLLFAGARPCSSGDRWGFTDTGC